jgi:hypothetical protein
MQMTGTHARTASALKSHSLRVGFILETRDATPLGQPCHDRHDAVSAIEAALAPSAIVVPFEAQTQSSNCAAVACITGRR